MRLSRLNRRRRLTVQPLTPVNNYTLARLTAGKSGFIVGRNQFGSRWIELRLAGKLLFTFDFINRDPYIVSRVPRQQRYMSVKRRLSA